MSEDDIWGRFGKPDYALAFHVSSSDVAGIINVSEGSPYAGADTVDIIIHGVGAHGAHPHRGKDPIVLGSQIVLALQTLVAANCRRAIPGVVTVGSFHSGTKHNIISDRAHLQLTVRNTSLETRELLLNGIKRIAENMGRVAGLPEDKLPEVIISNESVPPTINDAALARRLKQAWAEGMGDDAVVDIPTKGMGAEDFPFFTVDPGITSVYWSIGGTPQAAFDAEAAGGEPVPSHHSPLFKISPEPAVTAGVESTVVALAGINGGVVRLLRSSSISNSSRSSPPALFEQDLDFLFSFFQRCLAAARELDAFLEFFHGGLERQVARLEFFDEFFEISQ